MMNPAAPSRKFRVRAAVASAGLTLLVLLPRLGAPPLSDPSEARYAEAAREMYLSGEWYTVHLKTSANGLDVDVLETAILQPLLGITDVRTDKRIDFVGGIRGTTELEKLVNSGQAAVAFSMHPVSVKDLMRIADAGGIMPPKSTWFEPKLRDGLLSHLI